MDALGKLEAWAHPDVALIPLGSRLTAGTGKSVVVTYDPSILELTNSSSDVAAFDSVVAAKWHARALLPPGMTPGELCRLVLACDGYSLRSSNFPKVNDSAVVAAWRKIGTLGKVLATHGRWIETSARLRTDAGFMQSLNADMAPWPSDTPLPVRDLDWPADDILRNDAPTAVRGGGVSYTHMGVLMKLQSLRDESSVDV